MQHLFYHVFIGWNVGIEWNHRDKSGEMRFPARSIQLPTLWWTGASPQRLSWKFITFGVRPSYSQSWYSTDAAQWTQRGKQLKLGRGEGLE